jgi:hypothetical protein
VDSLSFDTSDLAIGMLRGASNARRTLCPRTWITVTVTLPTGVSM